MVYKLWEYRAEEEDELNRKLRDKINVCKYPGLKDIPDMVKNILQPVDLETHTCEYEDNWKVIYDSFEQVIDKAEKIKEDSYYNMIHLFMYFVCRPVFADIMSQYPNDDPPKIDFGLDPIGDRSICDRIRNGIDRQQFRSLKEIIGKFIPTTLQTLDENNDELKEALNKIFQNLEQYPELKNALNELEEKMFDTIIDPLRSDWYVDYNTLPMDRAVEVAQYLLESTINQQIYTSKIQTVGRPVRTYTLTIDGLKELEEK